MKRGRTTTYSVCGMPVRVIERTYGGGHIFPGATFRYGSIGREKATALARTAGAPRPPRPGHFMHLCSEWDLYNWRGRLGPGRFELSRRRS